MQISKILLIDNDNKVKKVLLSILRNSIDDLDISLLKTKKELDSIKQKIDSQIILVNFDLKWTNSCKLLKELGENYPFIGRIVFSVKDVDIMVKGQENIADGIINRLNDKMIEQLHFAFRYAYNRALERKELDFTRREYQQLLDNVPIGIYQTDFKGIILSCNKMFAQILGFENEDELIYTKIQDYLLKNEFPFKNLLTFISDSPFASGKKQLIRKDGEIIWVELNTKATFTEDNILLKINGSIKDISGEVLLGDEIKRSHYLMDLYMNSADSYFVIINKDETIALINNKLAKFFGYTSDEMIGVNWIDLIRNKNRRKRIRKDFQDIFNGSAEELSFKENAVKGVNGITKYFTWKHTLIKNSQGEKEALISAGTDITKSTNMEKLLRENEEKYRKLFETSPNAILYTDLNGDILVVNQQFLKMHGYETSEEIIGKNISSLISDLEFKRVFNRIDIRQFISGSSKKEHQLIRKNGSTFPAEVTSAFVLNDFEEPIGLIAITRDISDKKRFQKALEDSEKLYRTIFENTGTNMLVVDSNARVVLCNSLFEKFVGIKKNNLIGTRWKSLIHPNDYDFLLEINNAISNHPESFPRELEFRVVGQKGLVRNVWAVADIIPDTNQAVISIHDITEKTLMEQVKSQAYEQIERNLEQFAILVDNIRNPLAVIIGIIDSSVHESSEDIIKQINMIDEITVQLDNRWLESETIRNFLKEHM